MNRRDLLGGLGASMLAVQCAGLPVAAPKPPRVYKVVSPFTRRTEQAVQNSIVPSQRGVSTR